MPDWLTGTVVAVVTVALITGLIKLARWTGGVDEKFKKLEDFMSEIRTDIKSIFQKFPPPIAAEQSPMRLTKYGEELSEKLHAQAWAVQIAPSLRDQIVGKKPFEIHNFCKEFVQDISVATHPGVFEQSYENGITDEDMKIVLEIVLRDVLLKEKNNETDA